MKIFFTIPLKLYPVLPSRRKTPQLFPEILIMDAFKNTRRTTLLLLLSVFTVLFFAGESKANFTVQAGTIVRADTLTSYGGVLTINGTLNITRNTILNGFSSVVINAPGGQIYWTNNSDLTFAAGTSIVIKEFAPGLRPGGGNSSQRLWVGTTLVAVANNNSGPAALSFADMNAAGGLPEFILAVSAVSICYGTALTATLMPLNTGISYDCSWSVDNAAAITPATASNFNTAMVAVITPVNSAAAKVYSISCKLYKAGDGDAITTKTISVTVNPTPPNPTMAAVSPAAICAGSTATLTATSPGNTIEWYDQAIGGVPVGTSVSAASFTINPSKTSSYYAGTVIPQTGCRNSAKIAAGVVAVSPVSVGGNTYGGQNVCAGMNNNLLTVSDYTGSITRWESSTDNFATAINIYNDSNSLITSNLTSTTYYRAVVTSGVCPSSLSSTTVLTVSNTGEWLGVNTDWNSALNWCNGTVPASSVNINIGSGLTYYPVITGNAAVNDISIAAGAMVKVTGTGVLQIGGKINSTQGIDATAGTIEMNGNTTQKISASNFVSAAVNKLIVSNTVAGASPANPSVEVAANGGMFKISGAVSFGNVDNALLHTNDNVTLLSNASNTACIADVTNNNVNSNNTIAGKIVIERYIAARRAWRFLTAPVTAASNVTISDAWQEGARVTDPAASTASTNPAPGYGTHVSFGFPAAKPGYDLNINGATSIKYFTPTGSNGIPSATHEGNITDQPAYLVFVRGNRSTQLSLGTSAPLTSTVLRVKGFITTGLANVVLPSGFITGSSNFRVFRNPFPCAIDFHKIIQNPDNASSGLPDAFYMWDAKLGGPTGTGGWVALSYNSALGRYDKNVASAVDASGAIQSGSAVLIDYKAVAGNIAVRESDKLAASNSTMFRNAALLKNIRISLLGKADDSAAYIIDAAMISFDEYNSNDIDRKDMKKMENFEESFSLMTDAGPIVIERRKPIIQTDTIFCNITKMKQRKYQLLVEMESVDLPQGTTVYLEDLYLNTRLPMAVNTATPYDFSIDSNVLSSAPGRFRIVFQAPEASNTARLNILNDAAKSGKREFAVFPNPVSSNIIRLQMNETVTGVYKASLFNTAGERIAGKTLYYPGGKSIQTFEAPANLLNGSYRLQIMGPNGRLTTLNVIVQKK